MSEDNNNRNAGIERNVKTGSGTAVIVAVVVAVLVFIAPQLNLKKIEGWISDLAKEDVTHNQPDRIFLDAGKDGRRNLKVQAEKQRVLAFKDAEKNAKLHPISDRLPLLMVAVQDNNLFLIKRLIEGGTDPLTQDIDGNEALAYVTDRTSPETIAYLLDQGLDINHRNKFQNTPLMFAIRYENVPAVRFMVEHGADVQATTRSGRTMASMAQGPKVKAYLMSLDKPVPAVLTRVWWRQADLNEVTRAFTQNPESFQSRKILALAAANTPDPRVIDLLIDKGFDVNQVDETGITPIFSAASSNGNPDIIMTLVHRGADINRADDVYGTTPLMAAAYFQRNPDIFRVLINMGADPKLKDMNGQTAVDYAKRFNSREVISLLEWAINRGQ